MALVLNCWESADSAGVAVDSLTVNKPTSASVNGDSPKNAAIGDLLIIVVGNDDATDTVQWDNALLKPTGFTLILEAGGAASDCHCAAFYKVVDGTEGATFDIPQEATQEQWASCILISGAGPPTLHKTGTAVADETPAPLAITGVTNTAEGCMNFYLATYDGGDAGAFAVAGAGWAERAELFSGTASGDACGCWGTRHVAGTGASTTVSITPTTADGMYGFQFSIAEGPIPIVSANPTHSQTSWGSSSMGSFINIFRSVSKKIARIMTIGAISGLVAITQFEGPAGPYSIVSDTSTHVQILTLPTITQWGTLSVDPTTHAHSSTNVTVSQVQTIVEEDCTHALSSTDSGLTVLAIIGSDSTSHAHSGTSPPLEQIHAIAPDTSTIAHSVTSVSLTLRIYSDPCTIEHYASISAVRQTHNIDSDNAAHSHSVSSPPFQQIHIIIPDTSTIALSSTEPSLTSAQSVSVANAEHDVYSSPPFIVQSGTISPILSTITQTVSETILLSVSTSNIESDDCIHVHSSGNVTLTARHTLSPTRSFIFQHINEHITNPNMEFDSDWADYNTPTLNERNGETSRDGMYCRHVEDTLPTDKAGIYQVVTKTEGHHYGFSFDYYLYDTMYADAIRVTVADGCGDSGYLHNETYTETGAWRSVQIADLLEECTGAGEVCFYNNSDSNPIEFLIDKISLWKHVDLQETFQVDTIDTSTITLSSSNVTLVENLTNIPVVVDGAEHDLSSTEPYISSTHGLSPDTSTIALSSTDSEVSGNTPIVASWCEHDLSSTEPSLYQYGSLSPDASTITHTAGAPVVSQLHAISPDLSTITQAVNSPTVDASGYTSIVCQTATHVLSSTSPTLYQWGTLSVNNALHILSSTGTSASKTDAIVVQDSEHDTSSTEPTVASFVSVYSGNTTHLLSSDSPSIAQVHSISPANCLHTTTCEEVFYAGNLLCNNCTHDLTSTESTVFDYIRPIWVFATNSGAYDFFAKNIAYSFVTPNGVTYDFFTRPKRYGAVPLHAGVSGVLVYTVLPNDGTHVLASDNIDFVNFETESSEIGLFNIGATKATLTLYQILEVQGASHDLSVDDAGTVLNNTLTLQSATHVHAVTESSNSNIYAISGDTATHSWTSIISVLEHFGPEVANAQSCEHDTASSNVEMTIWGIVVTVADCRNRTYSTSPSIVQDHGLPYPAWCSHDISDGAVSIQEINAIDAEDSTISHSVDSPTIQQIHAVDAQNCEHDQTVALDSLEQWPTFLDVQPATTVNAIITTDSSVNYLGLSFGFIRNIFRPHTEITPFFMPIPLASQGIGPAYSIPVVVGTISQSVSEVILNNNIPIGVESSENTLSSTEPTLTQIVYTNLSVANATHDQSGIGVYFEAPVTAGFVDIIRPFTKGGARFIRAPRGKGSEYAQVNNPTISQSVTSPVLSVNDIDIQIMDILDDGVTESDKFTGDGAYYWGFVVEGSRFTANHRIKQITYSLTKAAGDISAQSYTCKIWTTSGNNLSTQVGAASSAVTGSNSWSSSDVTFIFSMPIQIQSGTRYAFTVDHGGVDNANRISIGYSDLIGDAELASGLWAADKSIVTYSAGAEPYYRIYCSEYDHSHSVTSSTIGHVHNLNVQSCTHYVEVSTIYYAIITYYNSASTPADNGSQAGPGPITITPPAAMAAGDLVIILAQYRGTATLSISQAGGQSWTAETVSSASTTVRARMFWCTFNGIWSANPTVTNTSGTAALTAVMHVFRSSVPTNAWTYDVIQTIGSFVAPAAPYDVAITGITTVTNGAIVFATWATPDDNTWVLQTTGWSNAGGAQYRNTSGSDQSITSAYKIMLNSGATGNVTNRQTVNGPDLGATMIIALKQTSVIRGNSRKIRAISKKITGV